MSKLVWDKTGERLYETGVDRGVVYPAQTGGCLLYTSPSPRDRSVSRMPSSA